MKESISSRVRRIISGSIHQFIDALENAAPEAVMEKAVSEIDETIEELRAELGRNIANRHIASKRLSDAETRHNDLSSKIELAVSENRNDLAEAAISRQLDIEAQTPVLKSGVRELEEKGKELETFIVALQAKKREMKEELRQFRLAQAKSVTTAGDNISGDIHTRISKAESAFDRVLEKQTGLRGDTGDMKTAAQLMELEALSRKKQIRDRLAAVKARMKGPL